ncbi:MAG: alpha/beta hydrolase, partial [Hyphomonadaceae bacterium]
MAKFRMIDSSGVRIRAAVEGAGPLVLMVHGFPESWYSWRHQLGPIAAAGFTACAIDTRGYGGSDKPHPIEAYGMGYMVGDIVAVANALSPNDPAILIGHDWGGPQVWNAALMRPDRFRAVCALSYPYTGVPPKPYMELVEEKFLRKNRFFYQHYLQKEGVAEAVFDADPRDFLRRFFYVISGDIPEGRWPLKTADADLMTGLEDPGEFPAWLTAADLDYYVNEFTQSGFRGPVNRYRNHWADFQIMQPFRDRKIEQPALFIAGARDGRSEERR